jgi:DNA-binding response OmpR family regulator
MSRILLIEADKVLADNLTGYFKSAGHTVDWCLDAQSAIEHADNKRPDLVLLDLMLCGRSGVEFLYEFRSYADWQELPVVIFSSVSMKDLGASADAFEHLGVSAYHYKPTTSLSQLAYSVNFILGTPIKSKA